MTPIMGKDVVLSVGITSGSTTTYYAIAACKECSISVKMDTQEVASPTSSTAKDYIPMRYSWSASLSGLVVTAYYSNQKSANDVLNLLKNGTKVMIKFVETSNTHTGYAYITDFKETGSVKSIATYSCNLQGTGALS